MTSFQSRAACNGATHMLTSRKSYSLNVLCRIEMVQRVMQQTSESIHRTRDHLEAKLTAREAEDALRSDVEFAESRVKLLRDQVAVCERQLNRVKTEKNLLETEVCERGIDMLNRFDYMKQEKETVHEQRQNLKDYSVKLDNLFDQLNLKRRHMMSQMSRVYPIVPFPDLMGGFSICEVHLPNSEDFSDHDDTMVAVGLGYASHLILMMSKFYDLELRYKLEFFGSRSSIIDHVNPKIQDGERKFPLHLKGSDKLHFNYAVYLLNKDISQLRHCMGLHTRDLRTTLSNLFDLLKQKMLMNELVERVDRQRRPMQIDEYLRRELEMLRSDQDHADNVSEQLLNVTLPSANGRLQANDRVISLSLDKGLNQIHRTLPNRSSPNRIPNADINKPSSSTDLHRQASGVHSKPASYSCED